MPHGYAIETRKSVFNDEGIQIAEFDIEVFGKVGTTNFKWLIECRDRPSSGAAPGAWIEQLVGRRIRFGFNKVTAVSTTGFAAGAREFAEREGIELRTVTDLSAQSFNEWILLDFICETTRHTTLLNATISVDDSIPHDMKVYAAEFLSSVSTSAAFLKFTRTGEFVTAQHAFSRAASDAPGLFDDLAPNGDPKTVRIRSLYTKDGELALDTERGNIIVPFIDFDGELRVIEKFVPILSAKEYRNLGSPDPISQVVTFGPHSIHGKRFVTEFHKLSDTGETHILLRGLPDEFA